MKHKSHSSKDSLSTHILNKSSNPRSSIKTTSTPTPNLNPQPIMSHKQSLTTTKTLSDKTQNLPLPSYIDEPITASEDYITNSEHLEPVQYSEEEILKIIVALKRDPYPYSTPSNPLFL